MHQRRLICIGGESTLGLVANSGTGWALGLFTGDGVIRV